MKILRVPNPMDPRMAGRGIQPTYRRTMTSIMAATSAAKNRVRHVGSAAGVATLLCGRNKREPPRRATRVSLQPAGLSRTPIGCPQALQKAVPTGHLPRILNSTWRLLAIVLRPRNWTMLLRIVTKANRAVTYKSLAMPGRFLWRRRCLSIERSLTLGSLFVKASGGDQCEFSLRLGQK